MPELLHYFSYLLRLWLAGEDDKAIWHASLDDPLTGERRGFSTLEALFSFLYNKAAAHDLQKGAGGPLKSHPAGSERFKCMYNTPMVREKLDEILARLRSGLVEILGDRLTGVYLYGSQARGDARPDSDIDVLIILRGEFDYFKTLDQVSDLAWKLSLENDIVIAQVLVSAEKYAQGDSPFLMNVRREAVAI